MRFSYVMNGEYAIWIRFNNVIDIKRFKLNHKRSILLEMFRQIITWNNNFMTDQPL